MTWWCGVALVVTLAACGSERPTGVDGSADGAASTDAGFPTPPAIPWLDEGAPPVAPPAIAPCPEGWREIASPDDGTTCEPYPETGRADCPAGEAHFPGEPGCAVVGDPCPAGDFASGLPSSGVIHVRAGAVGGDGSASAPFGRLADVSFGTLVPGATVALARGTYDGVVGLRPGVRLVGACAAETILVGASGPAPAAVGTVGGGEPAELRNVTIRAPPSQGVYCANAGRHLVLDGVIVEDATELGIFVVDGAELEGRNLVIRRTRPTADGSSGVALAAQSGATVSLTRALVDESHLVAFFATGDGTTLALDRSAIVRTLPEVSTGRGGRAFELQGASVTTVTASVLAENAGEAVSLSDGSTSATFESSVIRDTQPSSGHGEGFTVANGAELVLRRSTVERNQGAGIVALSGTVRLEDVVIRDTAPDESGENGLAVAAQRGAIVAGARAILARNHNVAVLSAEAGTDVQLEDLVIRDTRPMPSGIGGRGLTVQQGATARLGRALVEDSRGVGAVVLDAASRMTLEDVAVRTVDTEGDGVTGSGIVAARGGQLEAVRLLVYDARVAGVLGSDPETVLTLTDVAVRDTRARESDALTGHGVHVQAGATATGMRLAVATSTGLGVLSFMGSSIAMSQLSVIDTSLYECADTTCPGEPFGYGVTAVDATVSLTGFVIRRAVTCGVFVSGTGAIDLAMGEVAGARIGACVQVPGYDLARLTSDVRYTENEINLDSTELPVPGPLPTGF